MTAESYGSCMRILRVIDLHSHFPTDRPWFPDMGDTPQRFAEQVSAERRKLIQEQSKPYQEHWRRMWNFPQAEGRQTHPGDREQARRRSRVENTASAPLAL